MTPASPPPTEAPAEPGAAAGTPGLPDAAPVASLGYEDARDELVGIVARLEAGASTLEESLALWERGEALAARCQQWLDGARERLDAAREGSASAADPAPEEDR